MKKDKLKPFTSKQINPTGWMFDQLNTQYNGLSGNLAKFWPDISNSAWIGGDCDSWERVPYWLDGFIPLSYLLNNKEGIKTVKFYVNNIINRQQADGWIAPGKVEDRPEYDVWGIFIVLKALDTYAYITHEKRVYEAMYKALKALNQHIDKYPLFNWAKARWFECLIPLYTVYEKYKEQWLIEMAKKLHDQGFDYYSYYLSSFPKKSEPVGKWTYEAHGVNNAMAIKAYTLYSKITGLCKDNKKDNLMLKYLNKYHGVVTGTFNADECFAGFDPRRGSELCLIVELMFSLECLNKQTAKAIYQDQLERLAFNALPSATTNDMWGHQYDNQVNAPFIKRNKVFLWGTNGWESNLYGLEPHYGCCTSDYHQGWPKFVNSCVYKSNKGLVFYSYVPLEIKDNNFDIKVDSFYPFKKDIKITISSKKACHVSFLIPDWVEKVLINKEEKKANKGFVNLNLNEGNNEFEIKFFNKPIWENNHNYESLVDGPIVYALKVEQEKVRVNQDVPLREIPHADYEFHAKSDFAFKIYNHDFKEVYNSVNELESPFVKEKAYKSIYIQMQPLKYRIKGNYVIESKELLSEEVIEKEFIPIAINKLHIGAFKRR